MIFLLFEIWTFRTVSMLPSVGKEHFYSTRWHENKLMTIVLQISKEHTSEPDILSMSLWVIMPRHIEPIGADIAGKPTHMCIPVPILTNTCKNMPRHVIFVQPIRGWPNMYIQLPQMWLQVPIFHNVYNVLLRLNLLLALAFKYLQKQTQYLSIIPLFKQNKRPVSIYSSWHQSLRLAMDVIEQHPLHVSTVQHLYCLSEVCVIFPFVMIFRPPYIWNTSHN